MRTRRLMIDAWVTGLLVAIIASPAQPAPNPQQDASVSAADDPDRVISGLRQVAVDLADAVKRFEAHLNQEILLHDRGYRIEGGRRIPAADADLTGEPANEAEEVMRKLFAARMMASRRPGYEPIALSDCDRVQALIGKARALINGGNGSMRQFLTVSAGELNSPSDAELRVKRMQLIKVRDAALQEAKKAFVVLPFQLPAADSPEEQKESAWSLINTTFPIGQSPQKQKPPETAIVLPLRLEPGKRIALIYKPFRRVTLMDSGIDDGRGRRLFYQEEWEQRMGVTSVKRWAVAVNTTTGQHTMLRRYPMREFQDDLDKVYKSQANDYLSPVNLFQPSAPPSMQKVTSAIGDAAKSREELTDAVLLFKNQIRDALARNDAMLAAQNKPALDDDLPVRLREKLFAIRGHLAQTADIVNAESNVRDAMEQADGKAGTLEALAAWANASALEHEGPEGESRGLLDSLNRSDTEIGLTRTLEREALAFLPPEAFGPEAEFPPLMKDVIVRIRGMGASVESGGTATWKQEIWRFAATLGGDRQVKRTIVLIELAPKTGNQILLGREVKFYHVDAGEDLEKIYDENAAQ